MSTIKGRQPTADDENCFASILEAVPDFVASADGQGRVLYLNPAARRMLHLSDDMDVAKLGIAALHPAWALARLINEAIPHAIRHGRWEGESALLAADGVEVSVWQIVLATCHQNGQLATTSIIAQDVRERKKVEEALRWAADHDSLTGVYNRRRLTEEIERWIAGWGGQRAEGAVLLLIDLDDFKSINDTLGHEAGDLHLMRLSSALRRLLSSEAILARLGGDEFAVFLPQSNLQQVSSTAQRLLDVIRKHRTTVDGFDVSTTASIGSAPLSGPQADTASLLSHADIAMYEAKSNGGDTYAVFSPALARMVQDRATWKRRLRRALDDGLFELHAQPIVHLADGAVHALELLTRVRDPDGALFYPGEWLSIAERFNLIREIDHVVMKRAIDILGDARVSGRPAVNICVNVSGASLDEGLIEIVRGAAARDGLIPERLCVELPDVAAIAHVETASAYLQKLKDLGCLVALDDFGIGFNSLDGLKRLPSDYVKIEGRFTRSLHNNASDKIMAKAIIDVAHALGKRVVAEGVEDERALNVLKDLGADYGQGFLFARPQPLDDILATMQAKAA
ncbi:MAG: EAL domain-containing protein [Dehalococcoidia bacterium]